MSLKYCFGILILVGFLTGCHNQSEHTSQLMSIQIYDRNGFKETITSADRLKMYQKADFTDPQPYARVVRIYSRTEEGKTPSRLTTYHENGEIWQYLEVVNGRACGIYREWHPNGKLRLELTVIEGMGDLSEDAQLGWVFDGFSRAYDEQGRLEAEFYYDKGLMQGTALYYFPNGKLQQQIPYEEGVIDGDCLIYSEQGQIIGKSTFVSGQQQGLATFKGDAYSPPYTETYRDGRLLEGVYHDFSGRIVCQVKDGFGKKAIFARGHLFALEEYQAGIAEGEMQLYNEKGRLESSFQIKDGMKHGQEWVYYPAPEGKEPQPKLCITWVEDQIHGISRTWYPSGSLESEREMYENQKHGISSAWYKDGTLRLIEEYDHDKLLSGTYMKRGDSHPVSSVEDGAGIVTLYDPDGLFMKRITYEKGGPVLDEP